MRQPFLEISTEARAYAAQNPDALFCVNNEGPAWPLDRCLDWLGLWGIKGDTLDALLDERTGEGFTWVLSQPYLEVLDA